MLLRDKRKRALERSLQAPAQGEEQEAPIPRNVVPVINYAVGEQLRPCFVVLNSKGGKTSARIIFLRFDSERDFTYAKVDCSLFTPFGDEVRAPDIVVKIEHLFPPAYRGYLSGSLFTLGNIFGSMQAITHARITVKSLTVGDRAPVPAPPGSITVMQRPDKLKEIKKRYGIDAVRNHEIMTTGWRCCCGSDNSLQMLKCPACHRSRDLYDMNRLFERISKCSRVAEARAIMDAVEIPSEEASHSISRAFEKAALMEKNYGNGMQSLLRDLHELVTAQNAQSNMPF